MTLALGIDQGGTKTDVVIVDELGHILAFENDRDHTIQPCERRELRMKRIRFAADKAFYASNSSSSEISGVYACCIGADWKFEYEVNRTNVARTLNIQSVAMYNDCMGALRGGINPAGKDCAVVCLGTGTNIGVRSKEGKELIYGYYMHEEDHAGGGIGKAVFQSAYDEYIGLGPKTALTPILLRTTGFENIEELYTAATTGRTVDEKPIRIVYKDYAKLMFEAVRMWDDVAVNYINELAQRLCRYVILGSERVGASGEDFTVVLSGGIIKEGPELFEAFKRNIEKEMKNVHCVNARYEPVIGAVLYFYDDFYNGDIPKKVLDTLDEECTIRGLVRRGGDERS